MAAGPAIVAGRPIVAASVAILLASCSGGGSHVSVASTSSTITSTTTTTTAPTVGGKRFLRQVGLRPNDVPAGFGVHLIAGGDQVVNRVTLDLCSGSFPSEA